MAKPESRERLLVRFESSERLCEEFEKNIANGGIFVPSESDFAIRQNVMVEIQLGYAETVNSSLSLEGEVVHRIPPEMVASGVVPGVAIQFEASAEKLREHFAPLLGDESAEPKPEVDTQGKKRRGAKRRSVRVPIRVMPESSPPFEATSRDLSTSGILLSMGKVVLPIDEIVRICLWHPTGERSVEVDGKVVRQVQNKTGRIAAVAVAFDRNQASDPRVSEVIEALSQAGHRSRLGGISGSIADLGLANLLQMFGSSAPRGTVVCEWDGDQGWVAFADGSLLMAEVGALRGHEALVTMLDWPDGRFEFEANADENLVKTAERQPLTGAILEAVCAIDEREAANRTGGGASDDQDWAEQTVVMSSEKTPPTLISIGPESVFAVNAELEESTRVVLGKIQEAVLDLAKSGVPVSKLLEIIPEDEATVYRALEELVESGILRLL
jgi:Tfp pilus assembly protein PilZ